jgi:hypothetical protein
VFSIRKLGLIFLQKKSISGAFKLVRDVRRFVTSATFAVTRGRITPSAPGSVAMLLPGKSGDDQNRFAQFQKTPTVFM